MSITPARKFRMLLHINPTRQRGKRTGSLARASGWYMTFFAAGVIGACSPSRRERDLTSVNFDLIDRFLLEGQLDEAFDYVQPQGSQR